MTMTIRKQLSVAAWGASAVFCLMLLVSAYAAVAHHAIANTHTPTANSTP
jgi:hypothetical protein